MKFTVIWNDRYCDGPECCVEVIDMPLTSKPLTRQAVLTKAFQQHYEDCGENDEAFFYDGMESLHEVAIILGTVEFV